MTVNVKKITTLRLAEWRKVMINSHATPIFAAAVGHDHAEGELHLFIPDGMAEADVRRILLRAIELLDSEDFTLLRHT